MVSNASYNCLKVSRCCCGDSYGAPRGVKQPLDRAPVVSQGVSRSPGGNQMVPHVLYKVFNVPEDGSRP